MDFENYKVLHYEGLHNLQSKQIDSLLGAIRATIQNKKMIVTAGNGGSASTASHASCDFAKGMSLKLGVSVKSIAITDSLPTLTAWSNDVNYPQALSEIISNLIDHQDLFLAISGSGNSENIINAVDAARKKGALTAGISGFDGGQLLKNVDFPVHIAIDDMQVVENLQLSIVHWLLKAI